MSMQRFWRILNGHRPAVFLIMALALAGAIAAFFLLPKQYIAKSSLLVSVQRVDPHDGRLAGEQRVPEYLATQQDLLRSIAVAQAVVHEIGIDNTQWRQAWRKSTGGVGDYSRWQAAQLLKNLNVIMSPESNLVVLHYRATAPDMAASILNTWMKTYIAIQAGTRTGSDKSRITVLSPAVAPDFAASPKLLLNLVIGILFGTIVAILWVFLLEMRSPRIRSATDVEDFLNMPLLAEVDK